MDDGTIMINQKEIKKDLSQSEFLDLFPEFWRGGWKLAPGDYACCSKNCESSGYAFTVTVRFKRRRLNQVRLYPEESVPGEHAAENICVFWLHEQMGILNENPDNAIYEYEWGRVAMEQDKSFEPDCFIVIDYH